MDAFPFKFPTESRFGEKNDQNLYISANIITFEEFFYFYKTILEFPYLIDNINEEKYLLFIKILNIFKFERNSSFKNLIRFIWCSIIFNSVPIKERNFTSKKLQNYDQPKYIDLSKMVLVEILEIFKFSKEAISIIKDISWVKNVKKYYKKKNVSSEISKNTKIKAANDADEVKKSDSEVQKCKLHPPAIPLPSSSYTTITPQPPSQTCSKMQNNGLDTLPSPNT
ncbi:hypothetical protein CWI36_1243p0010, partial [Hamiltosporidium magnivora]